MSEHRVRPEMSLAEGDALLATALAATEGVKRPAPDDTSEEARRCRALLRSVRALRVSIEAARRALKAAANRKQHHHQGQENEGT